MDARRLNAVNGRHFEACYIFDVMKSAFLTSSPALKTLVAFGLVPVVLCLVFFSDLRGAWSLLRGQWSMDPVSSNVYRWEPLRASLANVERVGYLSSNKGEWDVEKDWGPYYQAQYALAPTLVLRCEGLPYVYAPQITRATGDVDRLEMFVGDYPDGDPSREFADKDLIVVKSFDQGVYLLRRRHSE